MTLPRYGGGRLPGRSTKEKCREEGEEDEGSEERRIRDQIIEELITGIQKKAIDEGVKNKVKRKGGQSLMRCWDCLQIENEEEEESWQERDQMAAQWDKEQKMEEILEQKGMEGSPGQLEVVRRVPELVVHDRMSQGKRVKGLKEKMKR